VENIRSRSAYRQKLGLRPEKKTFTHTKNYLKSGWATYTVCESQDPIPCAPFSLSETSAIQEQIRKHTRPVGRRTQTELDQRYNLELWPHNSTKSGDDAQIPNPDRCDGLRKRPRRRKRNFATLEVPTQTNFKPILVNNFEHGRNVSHRKSNTWKVCVENDVW
jgi:hypothetical protein